MQKPKRRRNSAGYRHLSGSGLDRYSKLKRSSERIRARAIRVQLGSRAPGIFHPRGKHRSLSLVRFHRTIVEAQDLQKENLVGRAYDV
jgi:hypothetical protein